MIYLSKTVKSAFALTGIMLFNQPVMASQSQQVNSISLLGEFSEDSKQKLHNSVKNVLNPIKENFERNKSNLPCHLHITEKDKYHLTVGTFEAADPSTPLTKNDKNTVWKDIGINLKNNINIYNQNGHVYGIYLFAHGYDSNNNRVTYHYSSVEKAKDNITKHFNSDKGIRLTHFHIVARYGTSYKGGPKGAFAVDCENGIQNFLAKNNNFKDVNAEIHGGEYCGHVTLAVMKRAPGLVTPTSKQFDRKDYEGIIQMYKAVADAFQNSVVTKSLKMDLVLFHTDSK